MADVIAIMVWLMLLPLVILYCIYIALADVIAKLTVADLLIVICYLARWQMFMPLCVW